MAKSRRYKAKQQPIHVAPTPSTSTNATAATRRRKSATSPPSSGPASVESNSTPISAASIKDGKALFLRKLSFWSSRIRNGQKYLGSALSSSSSFQQFKAVLMVHLQRHRELASGCLLILGFFLLFRISHSSSSGSEHQEYSPRNTHQSGFSSVRSLLRRHKEHPSDFSSKPRMVAFLESVGQVDSTLSKNIWFAVSRVNTEDFSTPNHPLIHLSTNPQPRIVEALSSQGGGTASEDIQRAYQHPDKNCVPQHKWESTSFPTCNSLHERADMLGQLLQHTNNNNNNNNNKAPVQKFFVGAGVLRNVWHLQNPISHNEAVALKTMSYKRDWTAKYIDKQRIDALVSERLTASPYVVDIYGYCGDAALYELAGGGSLQDLVDDKIVQKEWSLEDKYQVGLDMTHALVALHDIDRNGIPVVVHDDLDLTQFVRLTKDGNDKTFKLNDFNGARFVDWNHKKDEPCKFDPAMQGGRHRSPEEYQDSLVNEKIDIFALGYNLYAMLTGEEAWEYSSTKEVEQWIKDGIRQHIESKYTKSDDPIIKGFVKAINMCWTDDPEDRASAKEIQLLLLEAGQKKRHRMSGSGRG